MNSFELKQQLKNFYKNKDWQNAVSIGSILLQSKNANVWDYFFVASSYKNLKNFEESFKIAQEGIEKFKDDCKILKNFLAQLIYDLYLKNENYYLNDNIIDTWHLFNSLLSHDYAYLSKQKAFFIFVKNLSNKNALLLKSFFANFELTEKDYEDENITNRKITFPSVALTYVYFYSKILFSQRKFNECIELIQKITPKIKSYKFDYDIWLKRLLAKSYMYVEKFDNAAELYNQILKTKKAWFIYYEILLLLEKMNCHEPKKFFAFLAIADKQNPFYKLGMFEFFNRQSYDFLNLELIKELINELKTNKDSKKAFELNTKLQNEAINFLEKKHEATIKKILPKGGCFVKMNYENNKNEIFCSHDKNFKPRIGQKVNIQIIWKWNNKRNKFEEQAIIV